MKNFLIAALVTSGLFVLTPSQSQAVAADDGGLFLEPGVTYQFNTDDQQDLRGLGLMFRLGYHIDELIFLGADARYSFLEYGNDTANFESDATSYNLAPVVGIQMRDIGLRAWGSWVVLGNLDPDSSNGTDVNFEEAQGFRIGGGYHIYSFSVNLEYERINYNDTTFNSNIITNPDAYDLESEAWIISVSAPIEI